MKAPRPCRSILIVPGHKLEWLRKAPTYGADGLMFELEDAVPVEAKAEARQVTARAIDEVRGTVGLLLVRVNGWGTGRLLADLDAVVRPGLDGVALPKTDSPDHVRALDLALTELELDRGIEPGTLEIYPILESAFGILRNFDAISCSPRVRRAGGVIGANPGGDYHRAMGNEWTPDGLESLYVNARSVLHARAAGIENIIAGPVGEFGNEALLRSVMVSVRTVGANGALAIHPSQVPVLNEIFAPSPDDIDEARELLLAMAAGVDAGDAAVTHKGKMVDYAQVRTALDLLKRAEEWGLPTGRYPHLDVLSYE